MTSNIVHVILLSATTLLVSNASDNKKEYTNIHMPTQKLIGLVVPNMANQDQYTTLVSSHVSMNSSVGVYGRVKGVVIRNEVLHAVKVGLFVLVINLGLERLTGWVRDVS